MKGFTMIEILVVLAVIGLMASVLQFNFSSQVNLDTEATALADALRGAQSNALSGRYFEGMARCGYGVYFDAATNSYLIYAGSPATTCDERDFAYQLGYSEVRSVNLADKKLFLTPSTGSTASIFYRPPNPDVYINGALDTPSISIYLKRSAGAACPGSDCRTIYVTKFGQIEIKY